MNKWVEKIKQMKKRFFPSRMSAGRSEDQIDEVEKILNIAIAKEPQTEKISFWGTLVIVVFVGGFSLWAYFSQIESAAIAPGKIVVAGSRRVIQHLEGGIVSAISVKNGMAVKKGQVLLKIDDTQSATKFESAHAQVLRELANEARLTALIQNLDKITYPKRMLSSPLSKDMQKFLENQTQSFHAERATAQAHLKILEQRILQLKEQINGVNAQLSASTKQLALIKHELESLVKLEKQRLVNRSHLLSMQREEQRLFGLRGEYQSKVADLKQKVGETKLAILAEKEKLNKKWNEELRNVREKLALSKDREISTDDILKRTNVIAPIDGVVINLHVFTIGGVVKPGEDLMEIVPQHEELVVEARVNPLDIDVVLKGLKAKVSLSALKTRTTPTLLGEVSYVAADVSVDDRTQDTYYKARIQIDKSELKKINSKLLYPGMPVEVMIITNRLSPWEYFKDPIKRSFRRAFRED